MLTSIYLRDFRRHTSFSLTFGPGMNGLFGANYAGKTTILLAVAVALGGAGVAARGWRLVRRGATGFEIQLGLHLGGKDYRLLRTNSGAKLWLGEKLLATGHGPVNAEISTLIGMPVAQWLELRFVRQKAAAAMFEAGASKLNLLVEDLTGAHTITKVITALGKRADKAKAEAETCRSMAATQADVERAQADLAEAEAKLAAAQADVEALPGRLAAAQADAKALDAAAAEQASRLQSLQKQLRAVDAHRAKLETLQSQLATTADLAAASSYQAHASGCQSDLAEWEAWVNQYVPATKALSRAKDLHVRCQPADEPVADLEAKLRAAEEAAAAAEEQLREVKAEQVAQHAVFAAAQQHAASLEQQLKAGVCSACNRPFDGTDDAHRAGLKAAIAEAVAQAEAAQVAEAAAGGQAATWRKAVASHTAEAKALSAALLNASKLDAQRELYAKQVAELEAQVAELETQAGGTSLKDAEDQVAWLKNEITRTQKLATEAAARERLLAQLAEVAKAGEGLADEQALTVQIASIEDSARDTGARQRKAAAAVAEMTAALENARLVASAAKLSIERMGQYLDEQDQLAMRLAAAGQVAANAGELVKYLRGSRSRYLAKAWELILGRASAFADALTNGAVSGLLRTEDGQFKFMEGVEEAGVDEASGAQAAILGLGVQIGLAETLPTHLDLLLVDEPTADMDAEHSAAAILALSTCAKQVVAISHHRMDETLCNQSVEL